jgi:DNA-binding winged helix-turn-helix (wHTH) protein/tetratricopeptide (TPR) repeat protein
MSDKPRKLYEFENFRLDADSPSLWRGDQLVAISPKALEVLILLVENNGAIVSREDLLGKVWKDAFVEEGNINYTISLLRKTLGNKDLVQTISRHGYRFQGNIKRVAQNGNDFPVQDDPEIRNDSTRSSARIPVRRENESRPVFFTIALTSALLLGFLGFSWRGENTVGSPRSGTKPNAPNAESLLAYKRGTLILDDKDVEGRAQKALDEFQQAVTLDPTFALAYTGLAEAFASKAAGMPNDKSREFYLKAHAAVDKAFSLDQNLFEAFLVRGWLRRNGDWDWDGAESDLRRAIELHPDSALAHFRCAQLLANTGRHSEALDEIQKADALNPLSEMILSGHFPLLESAGEYDRALKLAEEYLQNNSGSPFAKRAYGTFLYHTGNYAKVIEIGESELAKSRDRRPFPWLSLLAAAYSKTGEREKADTLLTELATESATDKKALYSLAMNYAELGRTEEAVTALETCFTLHEQRMLWVRVEPRFANLKNEPRFRQLLGRMRLS